MGLELSSSDLDRVVRAMEEQQGELTLLRINLAKLQAVAERDVSALERSLDAVDDLEQRMDAVEQKLAKWTAIAGLAGTGGGFGLFKLLELLGK